MKINKIIAGALSLCIMFTGGTIAFTANCAEKPDISDITLPDFDPDAVKEQSYKFTLKSDGTYEISEYIYENTTIFQSGEDITLPSSYKGKPVTSIGKNAFCTNNADHITGTLTIPSSITSIGNYAFYLCRFTNCIIPSSVTSIGYGAFDDTPFLENMRKKTPLFIVNNILVDAKTVSGDVVLPNTIKTIPRYSFNENEFVTSVTIPDSVTTIDPYAFYKCSSLEKVNIPKGVTEIGKWSFAYCEKLSGTLTIPSNIKTIGDAAFWSCKGLTSINIQNGVTSIGNGAFKFCTSVTEISIPESVKTIGYCAFSENRSLKSIVVPSSVESIDQACFRYDYALDSVTILNSGCEIYDEDDTIPSYTTIYGYGASSAQRYAEKYDKKFVALNQTTKLGDVNGDGVVDGVDATLVLREYTLLLSGESGNFSSSQSTAANVNGDEKVDGIDATLILRYYTEALSLTSGTMPDMETWIKMQ